MAFNSQTQPNTISGGYDCNFVEEPSSDLRCLICLCVARDPLQHGGEGCGKIFCRHCITEYQKISSNCPNCRKKIVTFRDVRSERAIHSLRVRCENEVDGCKWVSELRSLEDHMKNCSYDQVSCPNECSYIEPDSVDVIVFHILRKNLQKHLKEECDRRQYTCPYCKKIGEYRFISGKQHQAKCPKMKIVCHNDECKTTFLREDKPNHLTVCPYEKVTCKYKDFGCEETPLRKDLAAHEDDDRTHLHMAMDTLLATKKELKETKKNCVKLEKRTIKLEAQQNHLTGSFVFKIDKFTNKKVSNTEYNGPPFFTHPKGYKMQIDIDANGFGERKGTHVSVWVFLMKGDYDDELEFPFIGTITFELLNQLEDNNHHKDSYTYKGTEKDFNERVMTGETASSGGGISAFIPHSKLVDSIKNCQYLKDDCLVFRISTEVPSYKPWLQCTS